MDSVHLNGCKVQIQVRDNGDGASSGPHEMHEIMSIHTNTYDLFKLVKMWPLIAIEWS